MRTQPLGQPVSRVDGRLKVTGTAFYAVEHPLSDIAYASVVHSTISKGKVSHIDIHDAENSAGVLAVIHQKNAPRLKKTPSFNSQRPDAGSAGTNAPILGTDEVFWDGMPLAVVVAETQDQADFAASLVRITYQPQEAATVMQKERKNAFIPKELNGEEPEVVKGNAETALGSCDFIVGSTYTTPPHNHNPIELHGTTAHWEGDDKLTVYDASQYIIGVRNTLATMFNLKQENVRVLSPFVGGGFGSKGSMWPHVPLCVMAAKVVKRPVRLTLSREGVFRTVGGRTPTEQHVTLGSTSDGKLQAMIHTGLSATSTTNAMAEPFTFPIRHLYDTPNLHAKQEMVELDTVPNTFMRAPGESVGSFALETAMDELAYTLNIDPIELRIRNEPETDPAKEIPFSSRHLKETYTLGAEKFGWNTRSMTPRSMRDGEWLIGWGMATAMYPTYQRPTMAKIVLCSDGTAIGQCATHEMGMGTATAQAVTIAHQLGLSADKVRFELGDTRFPEGNVSGGSSTTISVAGAVINACELLKSEVLKLVRKDKNSPLHGAKDDDVEMRDGGLWLKAHGTQGESYEDILTRHGQNSIEVQGNGQPVKEINSMSINSYGAQFCEVRVHEDTGEVRVTRWVGVFDCGKILSAKTARSQFIGGIVMGIGMALMEETQRDERNGRIMNPSLAEYHVPVNADVPDIGAYFLDIADPHTPLGAHGIGEIGITGAAAAVSNAVFHATGKRVRDLPITLEKLL